MLVAKPERLRVRVRKVAVAAVGLLATFSIFALAGDYFRERYSIYRATVFVHRSFLQFRTTRGQVTGVPYGPYSPDSQISTDLARAQLILFKLHRTFETNRLQGLVDIESRNWHSAVRRLSALALEKPRDAAVLNNLGVVYMQMAEEDPRYLLQALDHFEAARKSNPSSPEARFNLILICQRLHLSDLENAELAAYLKLDKRTASQAEITAVRTSQKERIVAQLQNALDHQEYEAAEKVVRSDGEVCRRIAMEYAMYPTEASAWENVAHFIGQTLRSIYGDDTVFMLLQPLATGDRTRVIWSRQAVIRGADLYLRGKLQESLNAYDDASSYLSKVDSVVDHLWLNLNRVDTEIRMGQLQTASQQLGEILNRSSELKLRWIRAMALSRYGATVLSNSGYREMLEALEEAIHIFKEIDAAHESVRALYYLAMLHNVASDSDNALKLALACLELADTGDHIRLASLHILISSILYRNGSLTRSVQFGTESVVEAEKTSNPVLVASAAAQVAWSYENNQEHAVADDYLRRAERATALLPADSLDSTKAELELNILRGQIGLKRGFFAQAEEVLNRNVEICAGLRHRPDITLPLPQSLMLLGQVYARTRRIGEAEAALAKAVEVVENDSVFIQAQGLRSSFDAARRELYDAAIALEYERNSTDAAWSYVQRYRAKLFLEFLAQFNPVIERINTGVIDRNRVQSLIPPDLQVIEYVELEDCLLIWLVRNDTFTTRTVPIPRTSLEQKIHGFLTAVRNDKPIDREGAELYNILIEPIHSLLDDRALAIIPDGGLHGLPFAALQGPDRSGKLHFLIQQYPILVSPTLTHLLGVNGSMTPRRDYIVSFGAQSDDVSGKLEIAALQGFYRKIKTYLGDKVTKPTFLDAMQQAPVFHYAGHSAHDAADPLQSSILLDGNRSGPNSVTAVDIAERRLLHNAVVVLSSCDSSVGNSRDGVGMRGLTSAFLIGGAGSVVGSLWPVEAKSTSELMVRFHEAFASNREPVAQALQRAQLAFLRAFPGRSHPYYWSGFVVTGNVSALR
jgi:CHAT domain-containing protein